MAMARLPQSTREKQRKKHIQRGVYSIIVNCFEIITMKNDAFVKLSEYINLFRSVAYQSYESNYRATQTKSSAEKKKCEIRGKKIDSMKNGWNSVGMSLESVEIARKVVYIARENQVKIKCENKSEDQSNVWGVTLRKVSFEMNPCRFTWVSFQLNTNNHFDLFAFFSRRVFACFVVMCSGDIVYTICRRLFPPNMTFFAHLFMLIPNGISWDECVK